MLIEAFLADYSENRSYCEQICDENETCFLVWKPNVTIERNIHG